MPNVPSGKTAFSLRLSADATNLVDQLATRHGITRTAVIEMAVRNWIPGELERLAREDEARRSRE